MRVLAIDTATLTASIALVDHDGLVRAESALYMRGAHSAVIVESIRSLLAQSKCELDSIDAFAAGLGPGSFTGTRIGVSIVKGFGLATNKPVYGVGSLELLAASVLGASGPVVSAIDARRNEVFFAVYSRDDDGALTVIAEPEHREPEKAGARIAEILQGAQATVIGDLDDGLRARVREGARSIQAASGESANPALVFAPRAMGTPLARVLASEVIAGRAALDTGAMEPRYVRPTDAKLPAKTLLVSGSSAGGQPS
jgi:tRNA threonylcarbamoyl adenosine modification protein YeaZ